MKDLVHASVDCQGGTVTKVATESIPTSSISLQPNLAFEEIQKNRHLGSSWAISEVTVANNAKVLAAALVCGRAIAITSNGSFKNNQGTAGFVIKGDNCSWSQRYESVYQLSYWSKIGGVADILESLHSVNKAHGILSGAIKIGLDGDQAMRAVADNWPLDPGNSNYNLLQHVRGQIKALLLTITFCWIASHQGKHKTFSQLDCWEQLNVECNGLAKSYWNTCALARLWPGSLQFSHEKWSLWIEEKKILTAEKARLYEYTYGPLTKAYWQKKHIFTPRLIMSINWEACSDAMGGLPFGEKCWLLKHATGFCGVGRHKFLQGNQDHSECPCCGDPKESTQHVVECKGTRTELTFTLATHKLEAHLTTLDRAPPIITTMMTWL
jgi:hypothetical protein